MKEIWHFLEKFLILGIYKGSFCLHPVAKSDLLIHPKHALHSSLSLPSPVRSSLSSCAALPQMPGGETLSTFWDTLETKTISVKSIVISPLYRGLWALSLLWTQLTILPVRLLFFREGRQTPTLDSWSLSPLEVCVSQTSFTFQGQKPKANWHKQQKEFTSLQSGMAGSRSPNLIIRSFSLLSPFLSVCLGRPL